MKSGNPSSFAGAIAAVCCLTNMPTLGDSTSKWRFDTTLNLFLAGMSGDVAVKGVPANVDATFKNIYDHLEASVAGRFTVGYQRWVFSTEFSYIKLGADIPTSRFDMEQWMVEPTVGYLLTPYAQLFAGTRYNNIGGGVTFSGPLGYVHAGDQDWWDPIVGANLSLPLIRDCLHLSGRFDVGGFGAASHFTWQAYPHLNWRFAHWGSAQLGYRWLGVDYETGSGANRFQFDVIMQGPQIGLTAHF